jgi:tetratricopeptide (TPR) repeat protein
LPASAPSALIAGDFDGALRTLTYARDPQQTLGARATLARSLAAAGEYDRAMEVAGHKYSDTGRMKAFIEIASVASSRGQSALAARAFEEANAAAEERPADLDSGSFSFRDSALLELARGQAASGDLDAAYRTAARIVRQIEPDDAYISDAVLNAHVLALAKAGDFDAAIVVAGSTRRYSPDPDAWRAIGVAAGRQGAVDAVRSRYPASHGEWRRAIFLLGLAEGLLDRAAMDRLSRPLENHPQGSESGGQTGSRRSRTLPARTKEMTIRAVAASTASTNSSGNSRPLSQCSLRIRNGSARVSSASNATLERW